MLPLIEPQDLIQLKHELTFVLIDARSGPEARANYEILHLQDALYVDLEEDLTEKTADPAQGGRHPLLSIGKFAKLLGQLGIDAQSHVIVYDDKSGANAASRFWWMLRSAGHNKVQVLDGGIQAALKAGFPSSSGKKVPVMKDAYPSSSWQLPVVNIDQVEKAANDANYLVIDVREQPRYLGEKEPIDLVAGHIPRAINIPFATNLNSNGFYLSIQELQAKYLSVIESRSLEKVIVHCGSGVTACHTILALNQAGIGIPALYVGSWSEWSRSDKPIVKEL